MKILFTCRVLLILLFVSSLVFNTYGQTTFQKDYQVSNYHHFNESVQQTLSDQGFVFQGWRLDIIVSWMKMLLVKTDFLGVVTWSKEYCKCLIDLPLCIAYGTAAVMGGCVQQTL